MNMMTHRMETIERARSALNYIDPSCDRGQWVKVGQAIHSEWPDDNGLALWDGWSKPASNYREKETRSVWGGFKQGGGVTIAALYGIARDAGWRDNGDYPEAPILTPEEIERRRAERERLEQEAKAEEDRKHAAAAKRATEILAAAIGNAAGHAYFERKGGISFGNVKRGKWEQNGWDDALLVPIYTATQQIVGVEAISPDGEKRGLSGCQRKDVLFPLKSFKSSNVVLVAEGISTAAAGMDASTYPAVCAFGKSNLAGAAKIVKKVNPGATVIILADIGAEKHAHDAAAAVDGLWCAPEGLASGNDFWDLWKQEGADAVGRQIVACLKAGVRKELPQAQEPQPVVMPQPPAANDNANIDVHELQAVDPYEWPNLSSKLKPLNTIPNLKHLLNHYGFTVSYDVIRKDLRIEYPGRRGTQDNAREAAVNTVVSLCALNGLPKTETPGYLLNIGDENLVNPVMDFITLKPWDGVSRFNDLMETVQTREGYNRGLFAMLLRRWMISAVAAAAMPSDFWSKGVLVFQGEQSLGKTAWIRALLPNHLRDLVKIDATINPDNKDTIISAISHWIVELGEFDGTLRKADIARLKGFISQDVDQFRRPYARSEGKYQRRTVFYASVNPDKFLVDDTGNVRFWTVPVVGVNSQHGIETQQLWAEVFEWFKAGERWWLTRDEEALLEQANNEHRTIDPIEEIIRGAYDCGVPRTRMLTAADVLREIGYDKPTTGQARIASSVLKEMFGDPRKSHGRIVFTMPHRIGHRETGYFDDRPI